MNMSNKILDLDRRMVDLWTRYDSSAGHEENLFLPAETSVCQLERELAALEESLALASPEGLLERVTVQQVGNVADVLRFRLRDDRAYPFRYLASMLGSLNQLLLMDRRPLGKRLGVLSTRLDAVPSLVEVVVERCGQVDQERRQMTVDYLGSLMTQLQGLPGQMDGHAGEPLAREVAGSARRAHEAVANAVGRIPELAPAGDPVPALPYRERLARVWGMDLDDLLSWHEEDIGLCLGRLKDIAASIDPGRDPYTILETDLPSCKNADDMFPLMEGFVADARHKSISYITLPEGEKCEVWRVPEHLKDSYPWGGYNGPDTLLGQLGGAVFLNDRNYKAVTLGWLEMMAIHECYPGHHAQRVKTAASRLPGSFKLAHLMNRASPLNEGIAHRSDELLQDIFPDRAFSLFVAYRRLHTAVRIKVDIDLHYHQGSIDDGVDLYCRHLGFDRKAARSQVRFQELWPGYMTVYYYGQKYLARLQERLGWDDQTFTELIFSIGYSGLEVLETVVKAPEGERESLVRL